MVQFYSLLRQYHQDDQAECAETGNMRHTHCQRPWDGRMMLTCAFPVEGSVEWEPVRSIASSCTLGV